MQVVTGLFEFVLCIVLWTVMLMEVEFHVNFVEIIIENLLVE